MTNPYKTNYVFCVILMGETSPTVNDAGNEGNNGVQSLGPKKADMLGEKISKLSEEKHAILQQLRSANKALKYKTIELEALNNLLANYNEKEVQHLQRRRKQLEFKIATNPYGPKREKELVKKVVEIEKKLEKYRPQMKAKKRKKLLEADVEELQKKVSELEKKLKGIRDELRQLFKKKRLREELSKKGGITVSSEEEAEEASLVTLEDVVEFEKEE